MGSNSIRSNLDKNDIISAIMLLKSADQSKENVYLVLEGTEDFGFIRSHISSCVEIFESFSGCLGVREIIEHFSDSSVIGICDRDYDTEYENEFIFFYDFCCLEMMLISNDELFESICGTYYNGEFAPLQLRINILEDLKILSILRKINFEDSLGVNFKGLSIKKVYNIQTNKIDITKIIQALRTEILTSKRSRLAELKTQISTYEELLCATNGHDFRNYLQVVFALNKPCGIKEISSDNIFMMFLSGFRQSDFIKTNLYVTLKTYESTYSKKILI